MTDISKEALARHSEQLAIVIDAVYEDVRFGRIGPIVKVAADLLWAQHEEIDHLTARVMELEGGLQCALSIVGSPIARRRLKLNPENPSLVLARKALKGGDA